MSTTDAVPYLQGDAPEPRLPLTFRVRLYFSQPRLWVELLVIGLLYGIYSAVRNSVGEVRVQAFANGRFLLDVEDRWRLALERPLNRFVDAHNWLADPVALHYATLHFIVTPTVLVWLFMQRKELYRRASAVLIVCTLLALIGFYAMPTAPPRMLGDQGFVDIMSKTSSWGWWPASGAPASDAISNQYAAMPSLHCAWATWCGVLLVVAARRNWVRVLGVLYPLTTYFVVMGTGNHYLLDVLAGLLVLSIAAATVLGIRAAWLRWGPQARDAARPVPVRSH